MLENLSEELLVRRGGLDIYLHELNMLSGEAQEHIRSLELQADVKNHKAIADLQNTVEQMVNVLAFTQQQTYAMKQDVGHLRKNLQQVLKHPISSVVGKFPRIFRDLSVQYGKRVELVVQGSDIEIERLLSEAIADPLELLLRNAFEHGIESPEQRHQAGKPQQGRIEFIAAQNEENTIIKIKDDGDGIDVEKIRNHVEQSAAIAGVAGFSTMGMSDQQIMNLIFEANFNIEHSNSFSEFGTTLSSLRKKFSNFGGTISVESQKGKGTEFTLVLPNILSLIRVLLFDINQMCFAIPSKIILEVIPREVLAEDSETLAWRDRSLPIVRIDSLFKRNCRQNSEHLPLTESYKPANAEPSFLIINYEDNLFALQTDGCWHDQEATIHQIEGDISLPHNLLGAVILGNNQAIPLINPADLLGQNYLTPTHSNLDNLGSLSDFFDRGDDLPQFNLIQSLSKIEPSSETERVNYPTKRLGQPRVLIVESSANVRRYLAMTLTKSGFLTEQVQNVSEAIAFLRQRREQTPNIDVVITDLEMPQMDGFKLLANMRDDTYLQNLPIVVLTAKNNENDQQLALDLGANAYFSKPYREEELIKTLFQLVN
jgi:chemosensory pili system protein ChpA (sensor histidine kinase/response regulator)